MAAKRVNRPSDDTSYNKYSTGEEETHGTNIGKSLQKNVAYSETVSGFLAQNPDDMSPLVFYDIQDAAKILEKAPVTVRKEAREQHIGTIKGQGYLFNDRDILKLMAIFEDREERRRHPMDRGKPKEQVGIARAVFEQLVYLKKIVLECKKDRERFLMLFQDFFNDYQAWREEVNEKLKRRG